MSSYLFRWMVNVYNFFSYSYGEVEIWWGEMISQKKFRGRKLHPNSTRLQYLLGIFVLEIWDQVHFLGKQLVKSSISKHLIEEYLFIQLFEVYFILVYIYFNSILFQNEDQGFDESPSLILCNYLCDGVIEENTFAFVRGFEALEQAITTTPSTMPPMPWFIYTWSNVLLIQFCY